MKDRPETATPEESWYIRGTPPEEVLREMLMKHYSARGAEIGVTEHGDKVYAIERDSAEPRKFASVGRGFTPCSAEEFAEATKGLPEDRPAEGPLDAWPGDRRESDQHGIAVHPSHLPTVVDLLEDEVRSLRLQVSDLLGRVSTIASEERERCVAYAWRTERMHAARAQQVIDDSDRADREAQADDEMMHMHRAEGAGSVAMGLRHAMSAMVSPSSSPAKSGGSPR